VIANTLYAIIVSCVCTFLNASEAQGRCARGEEARVNEASSKDVKSGDRITLLYNAKALSLRCLITPVSIQKND
jgi:hypothetical protein